MYTWILVTWFSKTSALHLQVQSGPRACFCSLEMFLRKPLGLCPCYATCPPVVALELPHCPCLFSLGPAYCCPITHLLTHFRWFFLSLVQFGFQCQAFRTFSHLAPPYLLSKTRFLRLSSFPLRSGKADFPWVHSFFPSRWGEQCLFLHLKQCPLFTPLSTLFKRQISFHFLPIYSGFHSLVNFTCGYDVIQLSLHTQKLSICLSCILISIRTDSSISPQN